MAERLGVLAIVGGFFMFLKLFGGVLGSDLSFLVRQHDHHNLKFYIWAIRFQSKL